MKNIHRYLTIAILLTLLGCSGNDLRTRVCFTTHHHEKVIPNITIWVKFNSETFPGWDPPYNFDTSIESDENGRVCMNDFPLGHHWFVGFGYDPEIGQQVIGSWDYEFNLRNLEVDTILYVGEE